MYKAMDMNKGLKSAISVLAFCAMTASASAATTYTYVGSWNLGESGAVWYSNPIVYTGQEAAAALFGGTASDYVISTAGIDSALINFSTWLDGWADPFTYATSGTPAAQDFSLDSTGLGYNGCSIAATSCYQSAYSALVLDHFYGYGGPNNTTYVNYAFKVENTPSAVPVPAAGGLLVLAMGAIGAVRAARRKSA